MLIIHGCKACPKTRYLLCATLKTEIKTELFKVSFLVIFLIFHFSKFLDPNGFAMPNSSCYYTNPEGEGFIFTGGADCTIRKFKYA